MSASVQVEDPNALFVTNESKFRAYWRPAMAWLYMLICFTDFVFFPLLTMFVPAILTQFGVVGAVYVPWAALTLTNGGMIHVAFGTIIGITAWTRGQEKIATLQEVINGAQPANR